jgi:hypothetical protein
MPSSFYPSFFRDLLKDDLGGSLETVSVKCLLLKNDYTFSVSHTKVSDVSSSELVDGVLGYTRKVVPVTITLDTATSGGEGAFLNLALTDNASWTGITFTNVKGAALYVHSGSDDSLNKLIYYIEFNQLETATEDNFKILTPTTQPKIRRQ